MNISYNLSKEDYKNGCIETSNFSMKKYYRPIGSIVYIGFAILCVVYYFMGYKQIDKMDVLVGIVALLVGLFIVGSIEKRIIAKIRLNKWENTANEMVGEQIIEIGTESIIYSNSSKYKDFTLDRDTILNMRDSESYISMVVGEKGAVKTNVLIIPKEKITENDREIILSFKKYCTNNSLKISFDLNKEEYIKGYTETSVEAFKKQFKIVLIVFIIINLGFYFIHYRLIMTIYLVIRILVTTVIASVVLTILSFVTVKIRDKKRLKKLDEITSEIAGEQIIEINKESIVYTNSSEDIYDVIYKNEFRNYILILVRSRCYSKPLTIVIPKNKITKIEKEVLLNFKI